MAPEAGHGVIARGAGCSIRVLGGDDEEIGLPGDVGQQIDSGRSGQDLSAVPCLQILSQ